MLPHIAPVRHAASGFVFDLAFTDGLIPANHAARLRYLRHQLPEPDPLAPEDVDAEMPGSLNQRPG